MKKLFYIPLSLLILTACSGGNGVNSDKPLSVRTYVAKSTEADAHREFSFISKPFRQSELSFRVSGPVINFDAQSGQYYRRGELIASIDNRDFKIRRDRTHAVYLQAQSEFKRISALYEKGNISGSSYEKAQADLALAKAAYDTAVNELNDTQMRAPFDGYVQTLHIEPYQEVRAAQAVVTFIELSRLKIEAYVPEDLAMLLRSSADRKTLDVKIVFDELPEQQFTTSDIDISKSATSNNLSFLLTAILPNRGGELLGGMSGMISFDTSIASASAGAKKASDTTAVRIPQSAVCHNGVKGDFVWVVDAESGVVASRTVKVGDVRNNMAEISEGLTQGESVVLTKHSFMSDSVVVSIQ